LTYTLEARLIKKELTIMKNLLFVFYIKIPCIHGFKAEIIN